MAKNFIHFFHKRNLYALGEILLVLSVDYVIKITFTEMVLMISKSV